MYIVWVLYSVLQGHMSSRVQTVPRDFRHLVIRLVYAFAVPGHFECSFTTTTIGESEGVASGPKEDDSVEQEMP
ncbi:hypothetical protein LIER_27855 [Lithospermum erythrorhizon]|uniref:Secreted protein n=1 Tax=Lithospermum erythrorhizon TaxID=34254 RepID=A0AAV3RH42_LITER